MDKSLYTRPDKPRRVVVTRRERASAPSPIAPPEPLVLGRESECHVTPAHIAALMVQYLPDLLGPILEPSAGTGSLIAALLDAEAEHITAVEREYTLVDHLRERWPDLDLHRDCFLEYAEHCAERYSAIVMNPPFKKVRAHMKAARALLRDGGTLIALVPVTYEGGETLERLESDIFPLAPGVHPKLVQESHYNQGNRNEI